MGKVITLSNLVTKWKDSLSSNEYLEIIENVIAPNVKLRHNNLLWKLIFLSKEIEEYPFQMKCYYLFSDKKELIIDESIDSIIEQILHTFSLNMEKEAKQKTKLKHLVDLLLSLKLKD